MRITHHATSLFAEGKNRRGEVFLFFVYYIRKQNTKANGLGLSESSWIEGKWLEWTCMKLKSPAEFVKPQEFPYF